jgi:hypothetical protein
MRCLLLFLLFLLLFACLLLLLLFCVRVFGEIYFNLALLTLRSTANPFDLAAMPRLTGPIIAAQGGWLVTFVGGMFVNLVPFLSFFRMCYFLYFF